MIGKRSSICSAMNMRGMSAKLAKIVMRLWQIFADSALAFVKVRDSIETKSIHAQGQPKIANVLDRFVHGRVIEIQVRLMGIKTMPIVSFCNGIPRPV